MISSPTRDEARRIAANIAGDDEIADGCQHIAADRCEGEAVALPGVTAAVGSGGARPCFDVVFVVPGKKKPDPPE
jgi:hypothetical protein